MTLTFLDITDRITAGLIAAAIAGTGLYTLATTPREGTTLGEVGNGGWQAGFEAEFNDTLTFRAQAVAAYNAMQVALFGQIQADVVIGREGWLFSETEYKVLPGFEQHLETNIAIVADTVAQLEARGIPVMVVVVPDKARSVGALASRGRGALSLARHDRLVAGLAAAGVTTFDAFPTLEPKADTPLHFLRTDTHWTPEGAQAVAQAALLEADLLTDAPSKALELTGSVTHTGDLYNFLDLGPWREALGFDLEEVNTYSLVSQGETGLGDLFGSDEAELHLVGTSYSEDVRWTFADALEAYSGLAVVNFAQQGYGPLKPMQDYLDDLGQDPILPELLIWELPEKYMSLPADKMGERADA
jgi:alginate O-acetyltransferase complex protein AlgJ